VTYTNCGRFQSRLARVENNIAHLQQDICRLLADVEHREQPSAQNSQVDLSLEEIKRGLNRVFTRYAEFLDARVDEETEVGEKAQ
jgi:hypothetical protein